MKLTKEQKNILVGTILGNAYVQKTGEKNSRLRLEHGYKQKNYLFWKVKKLNPFFQGKPKYLERKHPATKRIYRYWRHQSQSTPILGKFRRLFYAGGIKTIPDDIGKYITPLSLAVWYMDDGYYFARDKTAYLYLGNATHQEAMNVSESLKNKLKLESKVLKKKKGFALYFSRIETMRLKEIVKNFILKEFNYKLPS